MFGVHDYPAFVSAVFLFLALPGPGTFCLLTCTGKHGVRGGYTCLAGLMLGDQVLMWLAVAGVAALLRANPLAFHAMQYAGAGYLAYIGIRLLWPGKADASAVVPFSGARDLMRGLMVTLVNPKAIVFYMAFFPLFIAPEHAEIKTFAFMAATIAICTLLYCSMLILVGNRLARAAAQHKNIATLGSRLAGLFLVGFAVKLATP